MPKAAKQIEPISNSGLKELCLRYRTLNMEKKDAADAIKDLMLEVKATGLEPKVFKAACKELEKPLENEFKDAVNYIVETTGQSRLFA